MLAASIGELLLLFWTKAAQQRGPGLLCASTKHLPLAEGE